MQLNLILDDKSLALVVNLLGELGRDGVVSSSILGDEALVANQATVDGRLLNRPLANVGPFLL